jgi:hypothetical protein
MMHDYNEECTTVIEQKIVNELNQFNCFGFKHNSILNSEHPETRLERSFAV